MSQLTIYGTPVSSNARKVMMVALHLDLDAEVRIIDVYQGEGTAPEYLKVNPFGKVPSLVDGDFVLSESNAIMQYLDEAYGGYRLSSPDPKLRADLARWMYWEAAHWQPAWTHMMRPLVGHAVRPDLFHKPTEPPNWENDALARLLPYLEQRLDQKEWLVGDQLTLADFSVSAMMTYARIGGMPLDKTPAIQAWFERVEALDAWKETRVPLWEPDMDTP